MQNLLEQETTDEINEEDVTALSQGRRLWKMFSVLETLFEMWGSTLYSSIKGTVSRENYQLWW
jgi:hypothetical protein